MPQKVAVLLVHGVERRNLQDMDMLQSKQELIQQVKSAFQVALPQVNPDSALVFDTANWAVSTGLQIRNLDLVQKMYTTNLKMGQLREFIMDILTSMVVYQSRNDGRRMYSEIHSTFAAAVRRLGLQAGESAPLVVIAHSIGAVFVANYFYDLQWDSGTRQLIPPTVRSMIGSAPIENGHTLTSLFTMGNPYALWALRFEKYGTPIIVPAPELKRLHPGLRGKWVNLYDKDDPFAFPLRPLNAEFERMVEDREVNVGGLLDSWNPASHLAYWTDKDVIAPITQALVEIWGTVNRG
jgi:hypothetical protein